MSEVAGAGRSDTTNSAAQGRLIAMLERLPALANSKPALLRRGRHLNADIVISFGDAPCFVPIRNGSVGSIESRPQIMRSSSFSFRAPPDTWELFWKPFPRPGFHDIFAMMKQGKLAIAGDMHLLMCHLQYVKDLLALPRQFAGAN